MFHQVEVAGVVFVELDELDVVYRAVHPDAAQHAARSACVLYDKMLQPFHNVERPDGQHLFRLGRTKQVGHQIEFSKVVGHTWIGEL